MSVLNLAMVEAEKSGDSNTSSCPSESSEYSGSGSGEGFYGEGFYFGSLPRSEEEHL